MSKENYPSDALVEMKNISKRYGTVQALDSVDFTLNHQEILGLVGDNGAGKSTLIKILSGIFPPDRGQIFLDGEEVSFDSPLEARKQGIRTVHQKMEEVLAKHQDVKTNLFMGEEPTRRIGGILNVLDKNRMREESLKTLERTNIEIDSLDRPIAAYSGGQRQAVAIARAIRQNPKVLILDEPTSALGVSETEEILSLINRLGEQDISIIIISHDLEEVFGVVDRIYVLRNGIKAGDKKVEDCDREDIVSLMVGGTRS